MPVKRFLDTNILLYAYDLDAGRKRDIARDLIASAFARPAENAISVQVLQEFHVNFSRAGQSASEAALLIQDFAAFHVVDNTLPLFRKGLELQTRWKLSLWDAMILAAAYQSGASELVTEDFGAGQDYGTLRALNPFALNHLQPFLKMPTDLRT